MRWHYLFSLQNLCLTLLLVTLLGTPAPSYAQVSMARKAGGPGTISSEPVEWNEFLFKGEPTPTLRIPAAHQHAATGCYGYLYVTRQEIWYEVLAPAKDKDHAFRFPRASLTDARQWRFMGSSMPEVELRFSGGKVFHFFRVRQSYLEQPNLGTAKFRWDDVLSWEPLAQAALNFDSIVSTAEARQRELAPKPIPTVSLNVDPPAIEKGHPVTITWNSSNATNLDLEPGIGSVPPTGSRTLSPEESTTYILTAQGPGGGNNASGYVTVRAPDSPPAIVLVEPSVSAPGEIVEISKSPMVIRGIVMDSSGLPVVSINGFAAGLRPKSSQAAEFASDPMVLQPGDNRFEIIATSPGHTETKVTFLARFTPVVAPAPVPLANAKGLAKTDILRLLNADVPNLRIATLVKERGLKFAPIDDDFTEFRANGADDDLIIAVKQAAKP